jgi:hypothetical protein
LFLSAAAGEQWPWPGHWLQHKPQEPTRKAGCCYIPSSPAAHLLRLLLLAVLVDRVAAAFELDASTVDRRLVVVCACTRVAALLLLLLLLLLDVV